MVRTVVSWMLWPLSIVLVLGAVFWLGDLSNPMSLYVTVGRVLLVALIALLILELVLPYRRDWRIIGDRDVLRDIAHILLYNQVGGVVAQIVFLGLLATALSRLPIPHLWPIHSPFIVQVLLVMVVGDLLEYWLHRFSHTTETLWAIHAVHHQPTRMHVLKSGRHHLLYFLLRGVFVWTPLLLIGVPAYLMFWQMFATSFTSGTSHANIDMRIPGFMHRVFVTPQFHRLHHSSVPGEGCSNYALSLPIWDILFRTHTDPVKTEVRAVGIEGDPIPHRFLKELWWPFKRKTSVVQAGNPMLSERT
jgi:sterol desaturase/sphingolipid hydroxylase (fatty acid hydroxylase superfamily)